jgi:signal transduction histidine kinase
VRRFGYLLWPVAFAFGLASEWIGQPELLLLDAAAGFALLFLGLLARSRRSDRRVGFIMASAGFAWFLGTVWTPAVFLHRGPLAQLMLSYPSGKLTSRLERVAVGAAYIYAATYSIAANDYATIVFALGLVALSLRRYAVASGPERRARLPPLSASIAYGFVITIDAVARLGGIGHNRAALGAYDLVVLLMAIGLYADLTWGRWTQSAVTGLVVDLGEQTSLGPLRDRLARTLGDPTLVVGYWLPEQGRFVDEAGRPVELSAPGPDRVVTPIDEDGSRVAALVHDAAILADPRLLTAVASATRLALSNARLQAEVRTRLAEVEASRRRIVEAADDQRARLERELREGAERRLTRVSELLADSGPLLAGARSDLEAAQAELQEFARGVHPATLTEGGLGAAVVELGARSPVPVQASVPRARFPPAVEAAAYFVCSESLANAAKYAEASHVHIGIAQTNRRLMVVVADDGVGGADPSSGTGLRGLADRVEALGGRLSVDSPRDRGTRIEAELPCA